MISVAESLVAAFWKGNRKSPNCSLAEHAKKSRTKHANLAKDTEQMLICLNAKQMLFLLNMMTIAC
jgi:hypothetical protein